MVKAFFPIIFLVIFLAGCASSKKISQEKNDLFLINLLKSYPQYFDSLLKNNDQYGIQIIYTKIDRTQNNKPVFTDHYFNVDSGKYFYPASTVKLPTALLALQKLHELNVEGLDKNSTMITEAAYS